MERSPNGRNCHWFVRVRGMLVAHLDTHLLNETFVARVALKSVSISYTKLKLLHLSPAEPFQSLDMSPLPGPSPQDEQ